MPNAHAAVSTLDRGFRLGDGVFETCRVKNGKIFRLGRHLERLRVGADVMGISVPFDDVGCVEDCRMLVERNQVIDGVLRITLTRGELAPEEEANAPTCVMDTQPFPDRKALHARGAKIGVSPVIMDSRAPLRCVKTTSFAERLILKQTTHAYGLDEMLFFNEHAHITECIFHNIFFVHEGIVYTPHPKSGLLAGITREAVLEICAQQEISTVSGPLETDMISKGGEAFITSSLSGVLAVAELDGNSLDALGPVTARIQNAYTDLLEQENH